MFPKPLATRKRPVKSSHPILSQLAGVWRWYAWHQHYGGRAWDSFKDPYYPQGLRFAHPQRATALPAVQLAKSIPKLLLGNSLLYTCPEVNVHPSR